MTHEVLIQVVCDPDLEEMLGEYRMEMIRRVLQAEAVQQIQNSWYVAVTGALRWPVEMRPEVLIGSQGLI